MRLRWDHCSRSKIFELFSCIFKRAFVISVPYSIDLLRSSRAVFWTAGGVCPLEPKTILHSNSNSAFLAHSIKPRVALFFSRKTLIRIVKSRYRLVELDSGLERGHNSGHDHGFDPVDGRISMLGGPGRNPTLGWEKIKAANNQVWEGLFFRRSAYVGNAFLDAMALQLCVVACTSLGPRWCGRKVHPLVYCFSGGATSFHTPCLYWSKRGEKHFAAIEVVRNADWDAIPAPGLCGPSSNR